MRIRNLEELLDAVALNPQLARSMKSDAQQVGSIFGVDLTDEEARKIEENLDIEQVLQAAESVDSMADKVAHGIGLERGGSEN